MSTLLEEAVLLLREVLKASKGETENNGVSPVDEAAIEEFLARYEIDAKKELLHQALVLRYLTPATAKVFADRPLSELQRYLAVTPKLTPLHFTAHARAAPRPRPSASAAPRTRRRRWVCPP